MSPDVTLATHCGPVLLGQKPAALLSLEYDECFQVRSALDALGRGLEWVELRQGARTVSIMIYHRQLLEQALAEPVPASALSSLGYPVTGELDSILARLAQRMSIQGDFPHEIGFFLGYPQRDVLGFMRYRGRECKYAGQWKVYGDVETAKKLFDRYRRCSDYLLTRIEREGSLAPVFARHRPFGLTQLS